MKHSTLIKRARKYLNTHELKGICSALEEVVTNKSDYDYDDKDWEVVDDIQEYISYALGQYSFAHDWLVNQVTTLINRDAQMKWLNDNTVAIQKWRLQWMDILAAEYKAKGM
jgi:hypothetical protein